MLSDPQFWVAVAFAIFVIVLFNPVRKMLTTSLDVKINEIKNSIEEAENLKNETQITLNEIKKRQNEVDIEIEQIHSNSKEKIQIIETQAKEKLIDQIDKRELLTKLKIDQMVRDTNVLIKQNISSAAIKATINILEKKLDQEEKQNLINESIKDLGAALKH
jgi:F-type H+-transporting ATPase subunit b